MSFIQLAQQAQKELDGETQRLKQKEDALNTKSASIAARESTVEAKENELSTKERELQLREEEVTRREINSRRDTDVQADLLLAQKERQDAANSLKKAQEYRDDARMKLEDLERREVALSEREKTYKQEIELEVMRNFTFRK